MELSRDEVLEILSGCDLRTIYTKEYGSLEMTDEDDILDDFVPQLIELINSKFDIKIEYE